jgi:hypothetical protein
MLIHVVASGVLQRLLPIGLAACLLLTGCATSNLAYQWRSDEHRDRTIASILVVAVDCDSQTRTMLEDSFSAAISSRRTIAHASHPLQAGAGVPDGRSLQNLVRHQGVDAVAIIQPVTITDYQVFGQPNRPGAGLYPEDYSAALEYMKRQRNAGEEPDYFLSASLYDAIDGVELWMANSRTRGEDESAEHFTRAATRLFVESLDGYGLLR